jgi:hypothetical protein
MKKTLNMWMNTEKIIRFADHAWTERINQPNGTLAEMNRTLSNAVSALPL